MSDCSLPNTMGVKVGQPNKHASFHISFITGHYSCLQTFAIFTSEAALCPLQPCYFAKWDILADTSDYQYVMGFPARIFNHFLPIFCIPCHRLMYERDCPIFQKLFFPKIRIPVQLLFSSFYI